MKTRGEVLAVSGGLVLALLYLSGVVFHAGYLREWRLPVGLLPLNYHAALEAGSYAWMGIGLPTRWLFFWMACGSLTALGIYADVRRRRLAAQRSKATGLSLAHAVPRPSQMDAARVSEKLQPEDEPSVKAVFDVIYPPARAALFALAALTALGLSLKVFANAGAELAMDRANCPDSTVEPVPVGCEQVEFEFADNAPKIVGRLLHCTEQHCVVQQPGGVLVVRLEGIRGIVIPTDGKARAFPRSTVQ